MWRCSLSLLLSLGSAKAYSKTTDLIWAAEKKRSVVSGVLSPASVSVNGQEIQQTNDAYDALLINGHDAKITEVGSLKTFYEAVEGDHIELKWKLATGGTKDIQTMGYPAVTRMEFADNKFILFFNELTKKVRYDGTDIEIKQPMVIEIPSTAAWLSVSHTLELTSEKNETQIYNLDFKSARKRMMTSTSWGLTISEAPFFANDRPTMLGVSARVLDENNFSREIHMSYGKTHYGLGPQPFTNEVTQSALRLGGRWGYNPFVTNQGNFDYRRFTLGLQAELINYTRESIYPTMFTDGYNSSSVNTWFSQGGGFFRFEPFQYADFGLSLNIDIRFFRTQDNISSNEDTKYFALSYYF